MDNEVLRELLKAMAKHGNDENLRALGKKMADMYSSNGYPPDMFLKHVEKTNYLTKSEMLFILAEYQTHMLEHRRRSGISEKGVERIRKQNRMVLRRFIDTGETGIY